MSETGEKMAKCDMGRGSKTLPFSVWCSLEWPHSLLLILSLKLKLHLKRYKKQDSIYFFSYQYHSSSLKCSDLSTVS